MKTALTFASFFVLSLVQALADYARFTETMTDRLVCTVEEGERFCEPVTANGGTFSASLTVPGLAQEVFTDETVVGFQLGNYSFSASFADAARRTTTSVIFYQYGEPTNPDRPAPRIGSITFTRRGNVLTISGSTRQLDASIVADSHTEAGPISGEVTLSVSAGSLSMEKRLYYKGRTSIRTVGRDDNAVELKSTSLSGSADFTKPTITVLAPRHRARLGASVEVRGTARDNVTLQAVQVQLNDGPWTDSVIGTSRSLSKPWTNLMSLPAGTNTLRIKALDADGNESPPVIRSVIRH